MWKEVKSSHKDMVEMGLDFGHSNLDPDMRESSKVFLY